MAFAEQVDEMVERIIDEAIDFYLYRHGWVRYDDGNYFNPSATGFEMTPPGKPRTSGGQVTYQGQPSSWGFDLGEGPNAGSLVYGHFENTVREMFAWWKGIPEPAGFDAYLDYLRDGAYYVALTSDGNKVADIGNAELTAVEFLLQKIGGDDMGGDMILAFAQNFCTPLPTVLHGQYAVTLLVGTTMCAEKEIWVEAKKDVLAILDKMHAAMKDRGSAGAVDLGTITALVNIGAVFPTPAKPILAGAATVLSALDSLLKIRDSPTKPSVEFAADMPDGVIKKTEEALRKLAETIRGREDVIEDTITKAMQTVTDPTRATSFDMPKPTLLDETRIDGMQVDLGDLDFLATDTLPKIEKQLNLSSDWVSYGAGSSLAWWRPSEIGVSDSKYGPFETWSALASLAQDLTADLAWEVKESATHLALAADRTGRTEAEVEASMRRHAEKLGGGSGHDPIGDAGEWLKRHS